MTQTLWYNTTSIQELFLGSQNENNNRLFVKREDQNHPFVSGNKWWKLKYNLLAALAEGQQTLLTFGGAYSNHIFATAAAGKELGLKTIGVIRGEEVLPLNPTLAFAQECGMKLHFLSRTEYRNKTDNATIEKLRDTFGNFYLLPEGGTNALAIKGCCDWGKKLLQSLEFDYLCLPVGTGGTLAGLIEAMPESKTIIGFTVLKGAEFLEQRVRKMLTKPKNNWKLQHNYHFGGYAKQAESLSQLIEKMNAQHALPLDRIYTGKMLFGVFDLLHKGFFKKDSRVLILHTGGLQNSQNV
ncbi:MAG: 1-aminocyclopropane-1-carboxylate deaminase/D-cysteine desulfhydrase [Flammeovirgaceae bacterium]